jgi:transcriptional regulator with XRE-family HTH domain
LPSNSGGLPIICRDGAGGAGYGGVMFEGAMGEVMGIGTRQPDGGKVVKLRKQLEMKQEDLAERAHISVRHLREIERTNKSVPGTTITTIATVLKVPPDEITLSASNETISFENDSTRLKLRAVRSASELARLAFADRYIWDLGVDPTTATAKEMQQLLHIIRRLVERGRVTDEFDTDNSTGEYALHPDNFGSITRVARLQELLDALLVGGVGVLAGSYYDQSGLFEQGENQILYIHFVPSDVREKVISVPF